MYPELKTVIELQEKDYKIAELTSQIDVLPSQIQALKAELSDSIRAHEDGKQQLATNQKERKEMEGEIQLIREKISKHKDQLYEVKTNEQYRAMLKEIEGEEGKVRGIEDKVLERMIEAEELEKLLKEAASRLEGERVRVSAETRRLESARQAATEERSILLDRRKELEAALSESVRDLYQRVYKLRRGVALAEVRDGFCTACNVRLRPQFYNEVRANDSLLTCENCNRIIYCFELLPAESETAGDEDARAAV